MCRDMPSAIADRFLGWQGYERCSLLSSMAMSSKYAPGSNVTALGVPISIVAWPSCRNNT